MALSLASYLQRRRRLRSLASRFSAGDWCRDLPEQSRQELAENPNDAALCLHLDILHCLRGVTANDVAQITELMTEVGIRSSASSLRLLACSHRLGLQSDADIVQGLALRRDRRGRPGRDRPGSGCLVNNSLRGGRLDPLGLGRLALGTFGQTLADFPLLLAALTTVPDANWFLTRQERATRTVAKVLSERWSEGPGHTTADTAVPDDTAASHARSIAVVGNAPTRLRQEHGAAIDACDEVIRFNRTELSSSTWRHIGTRTDLWIMNASTPIAHLPRDAQAIAISGAPQFIRPSRFWRSVVRRCALPISGLSPTAWYSLVHTLQAPPSAGLLMLETLRLEAPEAQIRAFGFTLQRAAGSGDDPVDRDKVSARHHWVAEAAWLREHFARAL